MNEQLEKKLNERLLKWAGLTSSIDLVNDIGACLNLLASKLSDYYINKSENGNISAAVEMRIPGRLGSGKGIGFFEMRGDNPALVFCKALERMLDHSRVFLEKGDE